HIDYRWNAGDAERARAYAVELVALTPDVILSATSANAGFLSADILADVRPPHELEHRFNVPPRLGILGLTFFLVAAGPLRGGNDGRVAIGVQQFSGIVWC